MNDRKPFLMCRQCGEPTYLLMGQPAPAVCPSCGHAFPPFRQRDPRAIPFDVRRQHTPQQGQQRREKPGVPSPAEEEPHDGDT